MVGVPDTPIVPPSFLSASTASLKAPSSSCFLNFAMSRPISTAISSMVSRERLREFSKSLSCIAQNLPWACAANEASAAICAFLCIGSGNCRNTTRTPSG